MCNLTHRHSDKQLPTQHMHYIIPLLILSFQRQLPNIQGLNKFFWRVSSIVLSKIEGVGYNENKRKHNEYVSGHPFVANKLFINMKNYNGS